MDITTYALLGKELDAANSRLDVIYGEETTGEYILREFKPYRKVKGVLVKLLSNYSLSFTLNNSRWKSGMASHQYALYEVEPGKTYYITGDIPTTVQDPDYAVAAVYDGSGQPLYLEARGDSAVYINHPILTPANAATLAVIKYASDTGDIAAKTRIDMTGVATIDSVARSLLDVDEKLTEVQESLELTNAIVKGRTLAPSDTGAGLYDALKNQVFTDLDTYMHCTYAVEGLARYYVTGQSADGNRYPCVTFLDSGGTTVDTQGTATSTVYEDLLVQAPANAATMIVNRSYTSGVTISAAEALIASGSVSEISSANSYNLSMADELIRLEKRNPFRFAELDKGYVTFVFDDLKRQLDSIASIFEEHSLPMCIAAIPERLGWTCTELQTDRGSFTPGMLMTEVMDIVVENGGEVLTHNTDFITADNQYEYEFMHKYFMESKETLESYGYYPRGIIRSGGTGAITTSAEFDRWLVGNYEYADFGTLPQFAWRRTTIQQSQNALKAAILAAQTNRTWLVFMCHDYEFGGGDTFTGESDLEELLTYCESIGIDVVTCGYIFDNYSSSALEELGT